MRPAALDRHNEPLSFSEAPQRILVERLLSDAWIIPATARNRESCDRVLGGLGRLDRGAILSFGAVVIGPDGQIDKAWLDRAKVSAAESADLLDEAASLAKRVASDRGFAARTRIVVDAGIPFYVVVKTNPEKLFELSEIKIALSEAFGSVAAIHHNGNNLALLPKYLDKAPAVDYFIKTHLPEPGPGGRLILGVGDSRSDSAFLGLCDFLMTPSRSQLAERLGLAMSPGFSGGGAAGA